MVGDDAAQAMIGVLSQMAGPAAASDPSSARPAASLAAHPTGGGAAERYGT